MASDSKQKLVGYLEQHAFNPVMRADPDDYPEAKRDKVRDVQQATESEIERFRNYDTAHDVVVNFKRDLHSSAAKDVQRDLENLNLPTLHDVRDGFENLADDLGVG